ncbi:hypothetical protein [Paenibacillus sonchi]|uniref:hypothetical protein n=1 Tax=Paenibacillus sonchi TaxID=373687 RepID=UPI001E43C824|nr:hypothetical protein [Paenibacillus sonchi]
MKKFVLIIVLVLFLPLLHINQASSASVSLISGTAGAITDGDETTYVTFSGEKKINLTIPSKVHSFRSKANKATEFYFYSGTNGTGSYLGVLTAPSSGTIVNVPSSNKIYNTNVGSVIIRESNTNTITVYEAEIFGDVDATTTPTPSPTVNPTSTPVPSASASAEPTLEPTATPTTSPEPTPTITPSATPTATATPSPLPTTTPKPTVTPEQPSGDRAILTITLVNGTEKEYDLPIAEVDAFLKWYDSRDAGRGPGSYAIDKHTNNKGPFKKRKDYVVFDKILTYEISEYTTTE